MDHQNHPLLNHIKSNLSNLPPKRKFSMLHSIHTILLTEWWKNLATLGCWQRRRWWHWWGGCHDGWFWRCVPTQGTRGIHPEPFVNAFSMKIVVAFRYGSYGLFGLVLCQTNWASAVIGPGQSPAFSNHRLRVWLYCGPIKARYDDHGLRIARQIRELSIKSAALSVHPDLATTVTYKRNKANKPRYSNAYDDPVLCTPW